MSGCRFLSGFILKEANPPKSLISTVLPWNWGMESICFMSDDLYLICL